MRWLVFEEDEWDEEVWDDEEEECEYLCGPDDECYQACLEGEPIEEEEEW